MPSVALSSDDRLAALADWAARAMGTGEFEVAPASADASFRRYFRVTPCDAVAWTRERSSRWTRRRRRRTAGPSFASRTCSRTRACTRPRCSRRTLTRGFLLLSDLGDATYLGRARRRHRARPLFRRDRRADPLAARKRATACCRRTTRRCCARARSLSRLVRRAAPRPARSTAVAAGDARAGVSRSCSTTTSRSRACSCTATTTRAT